MTPISTVTKGNISVIEWAPLSSAGELVHNHQMRRWSTFGGATEEAKRLSLILPLDQMESRSTQLKLYQFTLGVYLQWTNDPFRDRVSDSHLLSTTEAGDKHRPNAPSCHGE
uniref:Uncharacterized protein n=1 Tax=Magallana gigas TaxID=29159 RepID=K1PZQ4_MAGGI